MIACTNEMESRCTRLPTNEMWLNAATAFGITTSIELAESADENEVTIYNFCMLYITPAKFTKSQHQMTFNYVHTTFVVSTTEKSIRQLSHWAIHSFWFCYQAISANFSSKLAIIPNHRESLSPKSSFSINSIGWADNYRRDFNKPD